MRQYINTLSFSGLCHPLRKFNLIVMDSDHHLCSLKIHKIALILLSFLIPFTISLSIGSSTSSLSLTSNSTRPHRYSRQLPECANSPDWATPRVFNTQHCLAALDRFHDFIMTQQFREHKEFRTESTPPQTQLPQVYLSQSIRFMSCSLGFAMLWDFRAPLPGGGSGDPHGLPRHDVSTWGDIYRAVDRVMKWCALNPGQNTGGWLSVGDSRAIGVFVVQAGSPVDELIRVSV